MIREILIGIFNVAVAICVLVISVTFFTVVMAKIKVGEVARDAARVAALTQDSSQVQNEINLSLQNLNLPTTWNGNTLFTVTENSSVQPNQTGFYVDTGPTTPNATVVIQYNVPIPFDRALTLIGGPTFGATWPITEQASYYNETQYTGAGT